MNQDKFSRVGVSNVDADPMQIATFLSDARKVQEKKKDKLQAILKDVKGPDPKRWKLSKSEIRIQDIDSCLQDIENASLLGSASTGNEIGSEVNKEKIELLETVLYQRDFTYGGVENGIQRAISADYFWLTEEQLESMSRLARILPYLFYWWQSSVITQMKEQGDPLLPQMMFGVDPADTEARNPPLARTDFVLDQDGNLKICEFETSVSGAGECLWTREAYNQLFPLGENEQTGMTGILAWYRDSLVRGAISNPRCVFLPREDDPYRQESLYICKRLEEIGKNVTLENESKLDIREDGLYIDDEKIDTVCNRFSAKDDPLALEGIDQQLYQLYLQRKLQLFPSPRSIKDNKLWLSLIKDFRYESIWRKNLGEDDYEFLCSLIPDTYIVCEWSRENVRRLLDEKWAFLKKAIGAKGMQDVYDLSNPINNPEELIENAISQSKAGEGVWVAQERIETQKTGVSMVKMGKEKVEAKMLPARIELYSFPGMARGWDYDPPKGERYGDVLVTLRNSTVVSGATDSIMIPVRNIGSWE